MAEELRDMEDLAANLALGTLQGEEREAAVFRQMTDPAFARAVTRWSERLTPLGATLAPVEPDPAVWRRIEAAIGPRKVVPTVPTAPPVASGWASGQVGFWRWLTAGTGLVAAGLALFLASVILTGAPTGDLTGERRYVATLSGAESPASWMVQVDLDRSQVSARPLVAQSLGEAVPELWVIAGGEAPRSLGLLDAGGARVLPLSLALAEDELRGGVLAISLEPEGGSPTGQPTGPVVFQGALLALD